MYLMGETPGCERCGSTDRKLYHVTDDIYYCGVCRPGLAALRANDPTACTRCGGEFDGGKWLFPGETLCTDCRNRKVNGDCRWPAGCTQPASRQGLCAFHFKAPRRAEHPTTG